MSGADEQMPRDSNVTREKPLTEDADSKESTSDDRAVSNGSNVPSSVSGGEIAAVTNGSPTKPVSSASGISTPPRCDSPRLRKLLMSPSKAISSLVVAPEPQTSTSEASIVRGDLQASSVELGVDEAKYGSVPEAMPSADAPVGNAPQDTEDNSPEAVIAPETEATLPEVTAEAEKGEVSEALEANDSRAEPTPVVLDASNISPDVSEKEASSSEAVSIDDTVGCSVPEALPLALDNIQESVTPSESERVHETKNESDISEKCSTEVDGAASTSKEIAVGEGETNEEAKVDNGTYTEPEVSNISEMTMDASLTKGNTSGIENVGKSGGPSSKPIEEAKRTSEPLESEKKDFEIRETRELDEKPIDKFEPKPNAIPTSKPIDEAMEMSVPDKSAASEESVEISEISEISARKSTTVDEPTEATEEAMEVSESAIESVHVSKPEASQEPEKPEGNLKETVEKPMKATQEQMETAESAVESVQVSEPGESEKIPPKEAEKSPFNKPAKGVLESGQVSKPGESEKIAPKEAEKSPFKKPAKGRLEDLKSDEPQTPKSPSRRSARLQSLQRTHSESPSPKKERKSVRSNTLERLPSDAGSSVARTRGRRVGSTSSNSEMEGSGDETKTKRVSRKDSKK